MSAAGEADVPRRAHANHVAFLRMCAERSGGEVTSLDGAVAVAPGHPFPFLNVVVPQAEVRDPAVTLDGAAAFFAGRDRAAWSLFTRDTGEDEGLERAARERGLEIVNPRYPQMIRTEPIEPAEPVPRLELREIADPADVVAYWRLCGEAYASLGFPPQLFDVLGAGLFAPPARGCLAALDGTPAGGAMLVVLEGVGLVAWVATAAEARGRGVGGAVTAWATNRAFEEGADFASLQASPMGLGVYERLGYRHLFGYRVWRAGETGLTRG